MMMGKKMINMIDKRLRQASGKYDIPFGGFLIILVGDFQQLPPVGDKAIYEDDCLLFQSIENVVQLVQCQRQGGDTVAQLAFKQVLSHCVSKWKFERT